MAGAWRTVRVFISSTFKDMQAERDHLVRSVFPRLREELLKRRIHLVDVDLRWGVTSEQDALEVCKEIIDECRPRFVCILGGRFGWTPPGREESITAAEVHYAVLNRLVAKEYRFFYFRDPRVTEAIPEARAREGGYREFPLPEEEAQLGLDEAEARARGRTAKLEALKQAVNDAGLAPFIYPARWNEAEGRLTDLKAFGEQVYNDLLWSIDDELGTETPPELDEFEAEAAAMDVFIEERLVGYVVGSRQQVLDELRAFVQTDGKPNILVITGAAGSGKSALLAKFYQDYLRDYPGELIIPHFVGASISSTDLRRTLRRICHEMAKGFEIPTEISRVEDLELAAQMMQARWMSDGPFRGWKNTKGFIVNDIDINTLIDELPHFMNLAATSRRLIIIIDAINQMDPTDSPQTMGWLPYEIPPNVRIILSSLEDPSLEVLRRRDGKNVGRGKEITLRPLSAQDSLAIIHGFLTRYHKTMTAEQAQTFLAKEESRSPLYLLTALEEIRTLGTYEEISQRIEELPGGVQDLFVWIFHRLEAEPCFRDAAGNRIGPELVRSFASLTTVSRYGLSQSELIELLSPGDPHADPPIPQDPQGNVAALLCLLRPYLMRRGALLDFYHSQFRTAVEEIWLKADAQRRAAHERLAAFFHGKDCFYETLEEQRSRTYRLPPAPRPSNRRKVEELAYQRINILLSSPKMTPEFDQAADGLKNLLTDLVFLEAKAEAGLVFDLASEFNQAVKFLPSDRPHHRILQLLEEALRRDINFINRHPTTLFQCLWNTCWWHDRPNSIAYYEATEEHAALGPPLGGQRPQLSALMELWRQEKERRTPNLTWLRSLRPPQLPLGGPEIACLRGHEGVVAGLAFSPNGDLLASSCGAGTTLLSEGDWTVRLWDVQSMAEVACIREPHPITKVVFLDGGQLLVTLAPRGMIRIHDTATGALERTVLNNDGPIAGIPDSHFLAVGGNQLGILDATTGKWINASVAQGPYRLNSLAVSSDGGAVAACCSDARARIWDLRDELHECRVQLPSPGTDVAFFPDNKNVLLSLEDGSLQVWSARDDGRLMILYSHHARIGGMAISPDGMHIGFGDSDGIVHVLSHAGKSFHKRFLGHEQPIRSVCFSPNGTLLVSSSWDETIRIWDWRSTETRARLPQHSDNISSMSFSPNGLCVITDAWEKLGVWVTDLLGGRLLEKWPGRIGMEMIWQQLKTPSHWCKAIPTILEMELVFSDGEAGGSQVFAWHPRRPDIILAHPWGHVFALAMGKTLSIFVIEGEAARYVEEKRKAHAHVLRQKGGALEKEAMQTSGQGKIEESLSQELQLCSICVALQDWEKLESSLERCTSILGSMGAFNNALFFGRQIEQVYFFSTGGSTMDSFERKNRYIDLMRASLRAAASGDATTALKFCWQIEQLADETFRVAEVCDDATERELLLDVVGDAMSFLSRSGDQAAQAGPNEFAQALKSAADRIAAKLRGTLVQSGHNG